MQRRNSNQVQSLEPGSGWSAAGGSRIPRHVAILAVVAASCFQSNAALAQQVVLQQREAILRAEAMGLPVRGTTAEGGYFELQRFVNGIPLYYKTFNITAAQSTSAAECWPGGAGGFSLTGTGVRLGIWDGGAVRTTHQEFTGRAVQREAQSPPLNFHATHVAGTMVAAGVNSNAKGMSFQANLDCHDWNNDVTEMTTAATTRNVRVSNHSYGYKTGWHFEFFLSEPPQPRGGIPFGGWVWYGDVSVDEFEDYYFGFYSFEAKAWDQVAHANPRFLWCKAAGNDRNEGPPPGSEHRYYDPMSGQLLVGNTTRSKDGNNGYDSISHSSTAKNGLTVGAVNDVAGGYRGPSSVSMSSFSCWGPTDDGRIKPDIVGNGVGLFSTLETSGSAYGSLSGTSMACPNVSGSIGLLIQHWRDTHPAEQDMLSSTMRGLVIHTADECGAADGPDYQHGWGLMNTLKAAQLISKDLLVPDTISERVLSQDGELELIVISDASSTEVRATLCWLDPPPAFNLPPSLDPTTKVLVNDLDLRMEGPSQVHEPWVLNPALPSAPAVRGDNSVDNVEQVLVANSGSQAYRLKVSHKGTLNGGMQTYSLLISGALEIRSEAESIPPQIASQNPASSANIGQLPTVAVTFSEPVFGVQAAHLTVNGSAATSVSGSGAGPYIFGGFAAPADGAVNVQVAGSDIKDIYENSFSAGTWAYTKADCNGNGVFDGQDISSGFSKDCNQNGLVDECDPAALRLHINEEMEIPFGQLAQLGGAGLVTGGQLPYTYEWTLRGNAGEEVSGSDNPTFSPQQPGTYVARVIVTDGMGCRQIGYLTVNVSASDVGGSIPLGPITVGNGSFCPFAGGMTLLAMMIGLGGRRLIRRRLWR